MTDYKPLHYQAPASSLTATPSFSPGSLQPDSHLPWGSCTLHEPASAHVCCAWDASLCIHKAHCSHPAGVCTNSFSLSLSLSPSLRFIYLKGRMVERERGRDLPPAGLVPKCSQQLSLAGPKPGPRNSNGVSLVGSRKQLLGSIICCLPRHISRKLVWKQRSQDSKASRYRT